MVTKDILYYVHCVRGGCNSLDIGTVHTHRIEYPLRGLSCYSFRVEAEPKGVVDDNTVENMSPTPVPYAITCK